MIQNADPGGEYYYSLGVLAPGIWSAQLNASLVNNAPVGRATQYAIQVSPGGYVDTVLTSNFTEMFVGGAFYAPSGGFSSGNILWAGFDNTTTQVDIRMDSLGHIYATRNGTQIGSASTLQVAPGSGWHYIEVNPVIATGTGGSIQVWIDNVSFIAVTGVNTSNSGNAWINKLRFASSASANAYWKDMYWLDTGTGINVTRLGDITVGVSYPNAAGVNQDWTNNGGSSETNSVQDGITHTGTWPDGDATYISSLTPNQISDFAHQTITLTGNIYAVLHASYMRKDDAGTRTVEQICLSNVSTALSSAINLGNSYQYYFQALEQDPDTSAAWTVSGYNNATFGVKEIS